jgi:hypothetical protein
MASMGGPAFEDMALTVAIIWLKKHRRSFLELF